VAVFQTFRGIGDLLWALTSLLALAEATPEGRIHLLTRETTRARALLAAEPRIAGIDYVPSFTGPAGHPREILATARLLRRLRPRALVILDKIPRAAIAARLAGVPQVTGLGFKGQARWLTLAPHLPPALAREQRIPMLRAFLPALGVAYPEEEARLRLPEGLAAAMAARFQACPRPWIALGLGASSSDRHWPRAHWLALLAALAGRGGSRFLVGGAADRAFADGLAAECAAAGAIVAASPPPPMVNLCPWGMGDLAGLLAHMDAFVGTDSGPLNLACALGVPSVGLFGVTPPFLHTRHARPALGAGMAEIAPAPVAALVADCLAARRAAS
jgi:heptosyltransferase-2